MLITLGSESKSDAHLYSEYVELYETAKKKEAPVLFNGYVAMSKDWDSHRKFNNPTVFMSLFAAGFITSKTEIDIELMGLNCFVEEAGKFKYRYPLEPHEISIGLFDIAHGGRWILKSYEVENWRSKFPQLISLMKKTAASELENLVADFFHKNEIESIEVLDKNSELSFFT